MRRLKSYLSMTKKDNTVRDKIIKGLELTHKRLIQSKKDRNLDLVISDNGRIIRIHARDLK
jgi:hypothetical protein